MQTAKFRRAVINCEEEKNQYEEWKAFEARYGINTPMPAIVGWHEKTVSVLGEWKGRDYHYAAIRFDGDKHHEIINPKYLSYIN